MKYDLYLGGTPTNKYKDAILIKKNQYKKFVHPNYVHGIVKNDIALIKLNKPISFSETIYPIQLPFHNQFLPENLTLTGWKNDDPHINPQLKETLVPTILPEHCKNKSNRTIEDKIVYGTFTSERLPIKFCAGRNGKKTKKIFKNLIRNTK